MSALDDLIWFSSTTMKRLFVYRTHSCGLYPDFFGKIVILTLRKIVIRFLLRNNFAKLNVFFEALNYETIDQKKAYELPGLFGE